MTEFSIYLTDRGFEPSLSVTLTLEQVDQVLSSFNWFEIKIDASRAQLKVVIELINRISLAKFIIPNSNKKKKEISISLAKGLNWFENNLKNKH